VDKTYLDKIKLRRDLIANEANNVVGCNPVATDAVNELYEWVFSVYLPRRFPTMFSLLPVSPTNGEKYGHVSKGYLRNRVTDEHISLQPPSDPVEALKILGSHVDDEFLILFPTPDPKATPTRAYPTPDPPSPYHLHAYVLTFPSGFNTPKKLGLPLAGYYYLHTSSYPRNL
jgi:hypothetical protein